MAAGSIIVDLLMRTGSFETDTKRAEKSLDNFKKKASDVGAAVGVALVAAAAGAIALSEHLIHVAGDFQDLSEMTGAGAEDLASYAVAAATAGVSMESLGGAMIKLTKNLTGVDDESQAAGAALAALGLNVSEFKQLDPAAQYESVGKALAGFADGAGKTAVAVALFGKSGAEQLKVFKALEEQGGRNVILTAKQIAQADEFADRQAKAGAELKLYAAATVTQALPAVTDLTNALKEQVKQLLGITSATSGLAEDNGIAEFAEKATDAIAFIIDAGQGLTRVFQTIGSAFGGGAAVIAATVKGEFAEAKRIAAEAREDIDRILGADLFSQSLEKVRAARKAAQSGGAGAENKPKLNFEGAQKPGGDKLTEAERYLENLQKQAEATLNLTTYEKLLADIQSGRLKISGKVTKDQLEAAATQVDQLKYEADQRKRLEDAIVEEREARLKSADAALEEAKKLTEGNAALQEEILLIGASAEARLALEKARISSAIAVAKDKLATLEGTDALGLETQAVKDQIAALERRLQLLGDKAAKEEFVKQQEQMREELQRTRDTIEGTLGQGLEDALNGNFKSIGDLFTRMLNRMVAEALAADLMDAVFGKSPGGRSGGGGLSGLFSLLGSAFGGGSANAFGGASSAGFGSGAGFGNLDLGGFLAEGGPAMAGTPYVVGERGPELFVPNTNGRVMPNKPSTWAGSSDRPIQVSVVQTFASGTTKATTDQAASAAGAAVRKALARTR